MSIKQHTQGPWEAQRTGQGWAIYPEGRTGLIGTVNFDDEQGRADAQLIAAAPDLLGALQLVREKVGFTNNPTDLAVKDVIDIAIEKALGSTKKTVRSAA